ncbi:interferon-inducible GTPase 5-like isoform X1 [Lates japonicus]|uniref:Interferon-inducible GTPase 5-like isoform X1 n=1 Tax=Lates japonicus TaxID=270547 RepID=A0AAD3M3S6_LATJO|nr:interferon-inducible GTPase 5-like isoform X1 [Lates japonicus]
MLGWFDFIIISDNFRENDVKLAKEIQKMEKKFYFVRSKIDHNLRDAERSQREFNTERTLLEIREDCIQGGKTNSQMLPIEQKIKVSDEDII